MPKLSSQSDFVASLFDPLAPVPAGVTTTLGRADAARFGVYRNNVMASLIGALEQRFPVTRRLVGDAFFRGMARAYAVAAKPVSPLMFQYGDEFPGFIDAFDAARQVPYLADMARLEAFWTRAYHAADATSLDVAAVAAVRPDLLVCSSLVMHPSAALLRSDWPVGSIWEAHQHERVASLARSQPETILVIRPDAVVNVHILPSQDAGFAEALFSGATLGDAAETAAGDEGFDFGRAIVGLLSLGSIQTIQLMPESSAND